MGHPFWFAVHDSGLESVHGGFNPRFLNTQNPSYVLLLPVLRKLEEEKQIGRSIHFSSLL